MNSHDSTSANPVAAPPAPPLLQQLRQRWQAWRDGLLVRRDFQRAAARAWPTRWLVRKRARGLFDVVAGFVYSQVLLAAVQLRLFEHLREGPLSAEEIAQRCGLPLEGALRLLAAASALELVEARGQAFTAGEQRYGLGALGAPMVGNEALLAMVEHHRLLYTDLADPVALLRGGGKAASLERYWAYATAEQPAQLQAQQVRPYSALMSASQPLVADEVLDAVPLRGHQALLDVGGGEGRFLVAAGQRTPGLRLMLFDLPAVVAPAMARFADAGLAQRAEVFGGDFSSDALPRGADIVSLVRVLYDHGDERALRVLRAAHAALPGGGTLLVAEPMAAAAGAVRMGDAYFGMYLLAMGSGRSRSAEALADLLRSAGFTQVREHATPLPLHVGVLTARKP